MANASANENRSYMGFFSSDAWGGSSQDSFYIQFWTNTSGIQTFRCECIDGGTFQGGSENRVITSLTPSLNTDYYIELKKAGNTHTYRITTNSDYTGGTTATVTQSGIADLRYFGFKARGDNQNNGGNNEGYIDDIKLWNNSTSATTPTGALVSSLSNKANLKAHYTMDTQGTIAYGTSWTQENNHNISSEENQVRALGMSHDGLYAFVAGDENGKIIRYALGTAWDLSSITGTPVQATIDSNPRGMAFNADGTLIFILYSGGTLKKYSPDSAYDIATLGSADQTKTSLGSLVGLHFKPDGTEFYSTLGSTGVKQFTLGSAWDISGATGGSTKAVSGENDPTDVWISSDGTKMFVCGYGNDEVVKYTMPAWDIGNSTADSTEFGVPANPFGLVLKPDGTKFILAVDDTSTDKLYEYKGGKSCPNDFSSTSALDGMTNLPVNTIFEQTDDTPSYWFKQSDNTWKMSVGYPTRRETFTSDDWTDSDSSCATVQTNNTRLWFNANNGGDNQDDSTVYDLGVGNVSDTKWTLRWEYVRLGGGGSGNGHNHTFGLAKNDQTYHSGDSTDAIMMGWGEPQNSGQSYMGIQALNNSTGNSNGHFPTSGSRVQGIDLTQDKTYYMELKRESASKATFTIWSDEFGGTALSGFPVSNTVEVSSSLADLRYIKWQNRGHDGTRSGTLEGSIKNVDFWNGVVL